MFYHTVVGRLWNMKHKNGRPPPYTHRPDRWHQSFELIRTCHVADRTGSSSCMVFVDVSGRTGFCLLLENVCTGLRGMVRAISSNQNLFSCRLSCRLHVRVRTPPPCSHSAGGRRCATSQTDPLVSFEEPPHGGDRCSAHPQPPVLMFTSHPGHQINSGSEIWNECDHKVIFVCLTE